MDKVVAKVTNTGYWTVRMDADEQRAILGTRGLQPATVTPSVMTWEQRALALANIRYDNRFRRSR